MATNKLFGYSVEEDDGKLVITIEGASTAQLTKYVKQEVEGGRGWRAMASLSPFVGLNRLSRRAQVALERPAEEKTITDTTTNLDIDIDTIFKQGFANPYAEFETHLNAYRQALAELRQDLKPEEAGYTDAAQKSNTDS